MEKLLKVRKRRTYEAILVEKSNLKAVRKILECEKYGVISEKGKPKVYSFYESNLVNGAIDITAGDWLIIYKDDYDRQTYRVSTHASFMEEFEMV